MPHQIGFTDNSSGQFANQAMLQVIHDFASANGWQVLRYDTSLDIRELILKGSGLPGNKEIFVGFQSYQSVAADYYNLAVATMTGYVASNAFDAQPGIVISGIPAHNQRIDYWLTLNAQRIALAMKMGSQVYESAYVGAFLPYARPSQYPYPMICGGMLNGRAAVRYSDTNHSMPYKGARINLRMWFNDGAYRQPETYPWNNTLLTGTYQVRDTNGKYPGLPVELSDARGVYGMLDGIRFVPGFDSVSENTAVDDEGATWITIQDTYRVGFVDYYWMRLDN